MDPGGQAEAQPKGVVELFTSQGCNSCPPADGLFNELAARRDLVSLAYHVDYWDYLGWRDTFARHENTERQKDYMRAFRSQSVYTPQLVVNGTAHVNGAKRGEIEKAVAAASHLSVPVRVVRSGDSVTIEADGAGATGPRKAHVMLVFFRTPPAVEIKSGENKGRKISYVNVVSDMQMAGMWHGQPARYELPVKEIDRKGGCAVLLQAVNPDGSPGAMLGAAIVRKPGA
jgi:hypothetical protein